MSIELIPPKSLEPTEQLLWMQTQVLGVVKGSRREGVSEGMLDKKPPYYLYVTEKGRIKKRKESTLDPKYMKIGTRSSPTVYDYITEGNWENVTEAAETAIRMLRRLAPAKTGKYAGNMQVIANGTITTTQKLKTINNTQDTIVSITNFMPYATALEHGFYVGRYDGGKYRGQGIFLQVTRALRKQYGSNISIRFKFTSQGGGTVPTIEIAVGGAFAGNDTRIGSSSRGKR